MVKEEVCRAKLRKLNKPRNVSVQSTVALWPGKGLYETTAGQDGNKDNEIGEEEEGGC